MLTESMPEKIYPTIEDVYIASIGHSIDHSNNRLLIFDVAGIEQSIDIELLRSYINLTEEFILVYSITDRSTYNLVDNVKKLIDQCKGKRDHPIIVIGNKLDLDNERQVGFDEALIWAKGENIKLFEVTCQDKPTLTDFIRYLCSQLGTNQSHSSTSSFKLRLKSSYPPYQ